MVLFFSLLEFPLYVSKPYEQRFALFVLILSLFPSPPSLLMSPPVQFASSSSHTMVILFVFVSISLLVFVSWSPYVFSLPASSLLSTIISLAVVGVSNDQCCRLHWMAQHSFQLSFCWGPFRVSRIKTYALYIVYAVVCPSSDGHVTRVSFFTVVAAKQAMMYIHNILTSGVEAL